MLTVYAIPPSLYCAKLRVLLRYKSLTWEEVPPPGGYGSEAYKALVPGGNLPALRHGELLIADSEAIAEYLEECWPDPPALPADPADRARARALSRFHDTRLEPAVRACFAHLPGRAPATAARAGELSHEITARLAQLARLLADMTDAGESLTLGECGYPISFAWLDALGPHLGLEIAWPDDVAAYRARLERLPAVAEELAAYRPILTDFFAA